MPGSNNKTPNLEYFGLRGSIALVTGATSGLGRQFALTLASAGCAVAITGRRANLLSEVESEIKNQGGRVVSLPLDVTNKVEVVNQFEKLVNEFGTPDILVNNAGIASYHGFIDAPEEETTNVFAVNQTAVWNLAQIFASQLVTSKKGGSIVNISSIAGVGTIKGAASYAVSKAAVAHLTKILAVELAQYDIRANAIAPGYIKTDLNRKYLDSTAGKKMINHIPLRRTGELNELDGLLLLLASGRSSFITGSIIPVDGGHLISSG